MKNWINKVTTVAAISVTSASALAQEAAVVAPTAVTPIAAPAQPAPIGNAASSAPSSRTETSSAMSGFDHAYKISGVWNISSINEKSKDLGADSDTSSSSSAFSFTYLKHMGSDIWIGPYLAYALSNSETDGDSSSSKEWRPGIEFRKVFTTKGNGYIASSLQAGWAFAGQAIDATDGEITTSINGFNYGVGLSLGNRVGEDDAYLIETGISYSRASLSGDATQGSGSADLSTTAGRFAFGISIGKLF
jgi:hypothetical protein